MEREEREWERWRERREGGKEGERGERVGGREGRLIEIWVREERKKKEYIQYSIWVCFYFVL